MVSLLVPILATGKVAAMSVTDLFKTSDAVVTAKVASVDNIAGTKVERHLGLQGSGEAVEGVFSCRADLDLRC